MILSRSNPIGNHWFAIGIQPSSASPFTASFMPDEPNGSFQ
jgi:hypothetical protein